MHLKKRNPEVFCVAYYKINLRQIGRLELELFKYQKWAHEKIILYMDGRHELMQTSIIIPTHGCLHQFMFGHQFMSAIYIQDDFFMCPHLKLE